MAITVILYFSLAIILQLDRCVVQSLKTAELLFYGRTYSGDFDDLAFLSQYDSVMLGGGPISIGFRVRWNSVGSASHIIGFDDGHGAAPIEVFNDGAGNIFYRTTTQVQAPFGSVGFLTVGHVYAFLITVESDGTLKMFYEDEEQATAITQIFQMRELDLIPVSVRRFRMNVGAAPDGSGTFDGDIFYVAVWNEIVTWDDMILAIQTTTTNTTSTTTTTTTTTKIAFDLHIQTSNELHADTQAGASVAFSIDGSFTQPATFCTHADLDQVISQSYEFKAWPKSLLLTTRDSAPVQDSWGMQRIWITVKRTGVVFVVLAPGNSSYALDSKYWIDGTVISGQARRLNPAIGAQLYGIPELTCNARLDIANAPAIACVQGGLIQHGHGCITRCSPGYTPSLSLLTCSLGAFTPESYTCTPNSCGQPPVPQNGLVGGCTAPLSSGDSCVPACRNGYTLQGETSCSLGDLSEAVCIETSCNITHLPAHASRGTCPRDLPSGQSCQLQCGKLFYGGTTSCALGVSSISPCLLNLTIEIETASEPFSGTVDGANIDFMFSDGWSAEQVMCENAARGELVRKDFSGLTDWPSLVRLKGRGLDTWVFGDRHIWLIFQGYKQSLRVTEKTDIYPIISIGSGSDPDTYPAAMFEIPNLYCEAPVGIRNSLQMPCGEGLIIGHGDSCTSQCEAGYVPTVPNLSCGLDVLVPQTFACAEQPCQATSAPLHGDMGDCGGQLASGTSCSFGCDDGYTLSGPSLCYLGNLSQASCEPASCIVTRTEHGQPGSCPDVLAHSASCEHSCDEGHAVREKTSCEFGKLTSLWFIANGSFGNCTSVLNSSAECDLTCDSGYHPTSAGSGKTTCLLGELTLPSCVPDYCVVALPKNAEIGDCPQLLQSGESCQPVCRSGHTTSAARQLSCTLGVMTTMECLPNSCDASNAPAHGFQGDCTAALSSNTSCQPTCKDGYLVSGPTSCLEGHLSEAHCLPMPCDLQLPDNGARGDCPDVLQPGSMCQPNCSLGYDVSGPATCNGGQLQLSSCRARSCDIFELPTNSISYGDCRSILESGAKCRPECGAGYLLDIEFECSRGTLRPASCKAEQPLFQSVAVAESAIKEDSFAETAFPYVIAGSAALLCLIAVGIFWCQCTRASKHESSIESHTGEIERQQGLIEQLRQGIDELNRRTILSEQERRELIQLRMPPLPAVDDEEWPRGGLQTLTMLNHQNAPAASVLGASDDVLHADDIRIDIIDEIQKEQFSPADGSSIGVQGCLPIWSTS
mmetsp:Transcript_104815/g.165483  ORF Transcript_104815/g.165483 Transcript_104815/m.165483 type:complete len:1264 (-) Transcript_104815:141-3932(-)